MNRDGIRTTRLLREELAQFLPNHRAIKAFENVAEDILNTLPDAIEQQPSEATSVLANMAFLPPPQPHAPVNHSDAQPILAAQIFGA